MRHLRRAALPTSFDRLQRDSYSKRGRVAPENDRVMSVSRSSVSCRRPGKIPLVGCRAKKMRMGMPIALEIRAQGEQKNIFGRAPQEKNQGAQTGRRPAMLPGVAFSR